jgi:hypothetical protein
MSYDQNDYAIAKKKRIYLNEKSVILTEFRFIQYFKYNDPVVEDNKVDQEQQQYKNPGKKTFDM